MEIARGKSAVMVFDAFWIIEAVEYKITQYFTHFCSVIYFHLKFHSELARGSDLPLGRYTPVLSKYRGGKYVNLMTYLAAYY
jgi:hypothetical protein